MHIGVTRGIPNAQKSNAADVALVVPVYSSVLQLFATPLYFYFENCSKIIIDNGIGQALLKRVHVFYHLVMFFKCNEIN